MRWIIATVLIFASSTLAADKVKLTLNWVPEPEFGGIYAAQQNGTFAKHNLDVTITPGGAGTPTWQLVANGKTDFAVASADEVFIARSQGADVTTLFATYQTCPQGLMVHASRGLKSIADIFTVGTLAMEPGLPYVNFLKNKYGFDKIKVVAYDGGLGNFLNNKNFSQQCFITSEPLAAKKSGSDPQVFLISDAGYNPYTAVIITTSKLAKENPTLVQNMFAALQEGWRTYLDDPKSANTTMSKLNPDMDLDTFAAAANAQKPLIETDWTKAHGLGSMDPQRWKDLGQQLLDLKVIDKTVPINECFVEVKK
ncbi:MAG TPA: ABC transporter substrate-binding protein [Tepidisphaeraceae bacterium]|jgi:NitT/TauT family transport system substrate-binding protein|nr:ABC transporter substrate-binding protein [Tepidisphaeraceae bacterium]